MPADHLSKFPNPHFLHPKVFVDVQGKREWEAGKLGYHIISLYRGPPSNSADVDDDDDDDDKDDEGADGDDDEHEGGGLPTKLVEVYQLLTFLWAAAKQCGALVTLREIPEVGEVTALCTRRASALETSIKAKAKDRVRQIGIEEAAAESRCLTEVVVLNLNRSSKAYVKQISKDDSTKSSLSRLAADQATLYGTPELNAFTTKLTESRDPMRAINMVRQETRHWGGSISDKSLIQFLSSGYIAPDLNKEPDGLTSLGFVPHHERHRFEDRSNVATDNMRAMFGEKTFDEDSIKRYTKKQFFLSNRIEDWSI
jgi:hypothetical protein